MIDARHWGVLEDETTLRYPCDDVAARPAECWFRGIAVPAPVPTTFRWLCQLKVAPYSYDLIDNLGRRSPRRLTPGADDLALGQAVMTIFRLESFAVNEHLTLVLADAAGLRMFGDLAVTYAVRGAGRDASRIVVKLNVGSESDGVLSGLRRTALAWGDLLMMRRQLMTLRDLAAGTSADR